MTRPHSVDPQKYVRALRGSGLTIYHPITVGDPDLWIPTAELEVLLHDGLKGLSLSGLPLRTRSKMVKARICEVLGYPVPASFTKTQPRFTGQMFDTYIQKSNNLQVWNEELSSTRRYVIIRVSESDIITRVKAVTGDTLSLLDTTGTLTKKYQARCIPAAKTSELIVEEDTAVMRPLLGDGVCLPAESLPNDYPDAGGLIPIKPLFERLAGLVGEKFADAGIDQERNRGAALHRLVCKRLGYSRYQDGGQFPDVPHQLLEVKLQTSPTVDLGLVCPNSTAPLDIPMMARKQIRHCDVRYAIFYARSADGMINLTHFFLTTGEAFFSRFPQFQGKVLNAKLQIPLPARFFAS